MKNNLLDQIVSFCKSFVWLALYAYCTGRLCADPVMDHYQQAATIRISFAVYNTFDEIDRFIEALNKLVGMLR
ncbi:aminotransferase class V-fold PLP-dependent enzyme [Sunxiuqinia elliptica]|uniref:Aminotransferase class V n=1 Tax=Sunxiuqinia elliptica TaxID=655355 RepID=A0A4R6H744_9BACT|nr:aminotransferase class V-fold PLP-dependent enzyme [Sunxiuqinia elliptica]TDO03391.1 aminotransferase class V [Sunxiuqinia elliptica]